MDTRTERKFFRLTHHRSPGQIRIEGTAEYFFFFWISKQACKDQVPVRLRIIVCIHRISGLNSNRIVIFDHLSISCLLFRMACNRSFVGRTTRRS